MARFKVWHGIGLASVILIIGILLSTQTTPTITRGASPSKHPPLQRPFQESQNFQTQSAPIPGVPAIPVKHGSITTAQNANIPDFSRNDVVAYLDKYGFYSGPLVQGATLKIVAFQFVPAKEATTLMKGESPNRPDNYLVCYVKVQGPFLLTDISVPRGAHIKKSAEFGAIVFDGHTGNLLEWSVY